MREIAPEKIALVQDNHPFDFKTSNGSIRPELEAFSVPIAKANQLKSNTLFQVYKEVTRQLEEELGQDIDNRIIGAYNLTDPNGSTLDFANATLEFLTIQFTPFRSALPELNEETALDQFVNLSQEAIKRGIQITTEQLEESATVDTEQLNQLVEQFEEYCEEGLNSFIQSFGFGTNSQNYEGFNADLEEIEQPLDDELLDKLLM